MPPRLGKLVTANNKGKNPVGWLLDKNINQGFRKF